MTLLLATSTLEKRVLSKSRVCPDFNRDKILFVAFLCIQNLCHENIRESYFSSKYDCVGSRLA